MQMQEHEAPTAPLEIINIIPPVGDDKIERAIRASRRPQEPDAAALRRRQRDERIGLEMLSQLERQSQEILTIADAVEQGDVPQHFAGCRAFRVRLSEFEAFCLVIENHLRKLAGDSRGELDDLFHKRRRTILRPSIKALTVMFDQLAKSKALPLGVLTILDEELRALDGMREGFGDAEELSGDDREVLGDIETLEALIQSMCADATEYAELAAAKPAFPPPLSVRPMDAVLTAAGPEVTSRHHATVAKVRGLLAPCQTDPALEQYAESDLRALDEIADRLTDSGEDRDALSWLRDICKRWASRLRHNNSEFMRIIDTLVPARG